MQLIFKKIHYNLKKFKINKIIFKRIKLQSNENEKTLKK